MFRNIKIILFNLAVVFFSFSVAFAVSNKKMPNDIRWVKESNEYKILCRNIFNRASECILVNTGLIKIQSSKIQSDRFSVVVDLDETILDNSDYQVERWKAGLSFTQESWSEWVNRREAKLVPGAREFLLKTRKLGVRIIFLSNRMVTNLEPTKQNLETLDVLGASDIFLLRQNMSDTKEIRRQEIINGTGRMKKVGPLNIVAYLGDQSGDFPDERVEEFGIKYFLFPNPMYGKW